MGLKERILKALKLEQSEINKQYQDAEPIDRHNICKKDSDLQYIAQRVISTDKEENKLRRLVHRLLKEKDSQ